MMDLIKRFVEAVEKIAASLVGIVAIMKEADKEDKADFARAQDEIQKPFPTTPPAAAEVVQQTGAEAAVVLGASWDPFTEPIQSRYPKDKQEVLKETATKIGLDWKSYKAPSDIHKAIHAYASTPKNATPPDPLASDPLASETPPEDDWMGETPAQQRAITPDELRKLFQEAAAQFNVPGQSGSGAVKLRGIVKEACGFDRFELIPVESYPLVYAAVQKAMAEKK